MKEVAFISPRPEEIEAISYIDGKLVADLKLRAEIRQITHDRKGYAVIPHDAVVLSLVAIDGREMVMDLPPIMARDFGKRIIELSDAIPNPYDR